MAAKPPDIESPTLHIKWDKASPFLCPICESKLEHEYNDGGKRVVTLKGPIWVITNYYKCTDPDCQLHKAFPIAHNTTIKKKHFGLDVWEKVVQHHFKHHLNYTLISEIMEDDWNVSINKGTVRAICEYFEVAGARFADEKVMDEVRKNGRIILSLDGAQPKADEPLFWAFSDRLTKNIIYTKYLRTAPAEELCRIYTLIEDTFEVPIEAVISDKQRNIVNSVKAFNTEIPHVFCQFHFLGHIAKPIAAKDSHLLKSLRSKVKIFSLVASHNIELEHQEITKKSPVSLIFAPLVEELKCAIATYGDRFKIFPGIEAYRNLKYLLRNLKAIPELSLSDRVRKSFQNIVSSLETLLEKYNKMFTEIIELEKDFQELRSIFKHRNWHGPTIHKRVKKWVSKLKKRLERRNMEFEPTNLKWEQASYHMVKENAWQQWIRLVASYDSGLYHAYNNPELEPTNTPKEQIFSRSKQHFRALLGRKDIAQAYSVHGAYYSKIMDFDFDRKAIHRVLIAFETPLIEADRHKLHAKYACIRRNWRIREEDTGNLAKLKENLQKLAI
jgi:hypothetical protein